MAFGPARLRMTMKADSMQSQISKAFGIAAMGIALAGPMPAMADGAASKSTVYRARNSYGQRVLGLGEAAAKGDFDAARHPCPRSQHHR